ncbi:uncharacterized protein FOMMEDRAFT_163575 [Fomitiporia mediterranea MF3/22]|uniref:Uncharacterized protein n=1 Tax=Fomitiporia mediterranea (strain MF3/22) TaxID=694068 RepID=R7SFA0_FOMME|nr:uncharacterized protein FOMMEDRAFT_163575 [Fomitiporia mediterranea MF3/22]EJC97401.1 hypothetical protein FOMMEDRAFT_163575 [Fomitiporia mediterranea MF3/22]
MLQSQGSSALKRESSSSSSIYISVRFTPMASVSSIVGAQCGDGNFTILLLSSFPKFARSSERAMLRDSSCITLVAPIVLSNDMEQALGSPLALFMVLKASVQTLMVPEVEGLDELEKCILMFKSQSVHANCGCLDDLRETHNCADVPDLPAC